MKQFRMRTLLSMLISMTLIVGNTLPVLAVPDEEPVELTDVVLDDIQEEGLLPETLSEPDENEGLNRDGDGNGGHVFKTGYISRPNDFPAVDNRLDYNKVRSALYSGREDEFFRNYTNAIENEKAVPSAYPAAYDGDWLNTLNAKFPGTRDQYPYGTCWAHSTMALAEFDLISQGKAAKSEDTSELHMAYWCYTNGTPSLAGDTGDRVSFHIVPSENINNILDNGGNLLFSAQTLMRQRGVVKESVAPYSQANYIANEGSLAGNTERDDTYYLKNAYEINIKENPQQVKEAIKAHGAVGVSICASDYFYNRDNNSFYCELNDDTNHAVSVVGWDDNFPRSKFGTWYDSSQPSKNGAWLVRNSWSSGSEKSFDSYFWLSYEDVPLEGAWVFEVDDVFPYDNHYYYDSQMHELGGYVGVKRYANVYTASGKEDYENLKAVSFEMNIDYRVVGTGTNYKVKIYKNLKGNDPSTGDLVSEATTSGKITYVGNYTVTLNEPVLLEKGEKFAVEVEVDNTDYMVVREYGRSGFGGVDMTVGFKSGQSYYYSGKWVDCSNNTSGSAGNLVISALTTDVGSGEDLSSLTLSPKSLSFTQKGESAALTATVLNKKGRKDTSASVSFVSSDPSVVSVTGSGQSATVKALSTGTTTITATSGDLSDTCSVEVSLKVSDLTANKASGSKVSAGSGITLSCATPGADIYYTLDGSKPSKSSNKYTSPIQITKDMVDTTITLKAIAVADGYEDSGVASFTYKVIDSLARIELSKYSLTITVENELRDIYATVYDEEGNIDTKAKVTWTDSNPGVISVKDNVGVATIKPLSSGTTVLTATSGYLSADCEITVSLKANAPTASKSTGSQVTAGSGITLSCTTKGAEIYYTLNGSTPSKSSEKYTSPIQITKDMVDKTITLKAIAVADGYEDSDVAEYQYTVVDSLERVELDKDTLTLDREGQSETLSAVVYDEDGNEDKYARVTWTSSDSKIATVSYGTVTAKGDGTAIITAQSGELSADCVVTVAIADTEAPLIELPGDPPLEIGSKISITPVTEGSTIYYTLDGTDPTLKSKIYSSPIKITKKMAGQEVVIKAAAKATGMKMSAVSIKSFTVEEGSGVSDVSSFDPTPDLETDELYLVKGQKFMLPDGGAGITSYDPKIASISKTGQVAAKSVGRTWFADDMGNEIYTVYVIVPAFQLKNKSIVVGDSTQAMLSMEEDYYGISDNYPVYWTCESPSVARIEGDGNNCTIYGLSKGSAAITAYVNGKAYKTKVNVVETEKVKLSGYNSSMTLSPMQTVKLSFNGESFKNVEWDSDRGMSTSVVGKNTVYYDGVVYITSAGKLTAAGSGTTTLTCENGVEIEVTVREPADRVVYINTGKKQALKYNGVKNSGITWDIVSNDGVINSSELMKSGKIVAMKPGYAEVSGTYDPFGDMGDGFIFNTTVYVENMRLNTDSKLRSTNQTSYTIDLSSEESYELSFVDDANCMVYQPVIFTSNKPDLVFVDETGVINAKKITKKTNATLTAKINGKKYSIKVTLYP
ncbi:MAG: chitobiase/beta-hexosaminidase C-terminal domain-containing protein [Lachnospiraceae bacterium]|nr:chitobiase/beta-hexosaminidase C-terminal domain-containing protein [Lachnospiraceae bacterium]